MRKINWQEYIRPECAEVTAESAGVLMGSRFDDGTGSEYIGDGGEIYI